MRLFRLLTAAALAAMTLLSCVNKKAALYYLGYHDLNLWSKADSNL